MIKKLAFGFIFLTTFAYFSFNLQAIKFPYLIFNFDLKTLTTYSLLIGSALLSSLSFVIFASFIQKWSVVLVVSMIAAVIPGLILSGIGFLIGAGFFIVSAIVYSILNNHLKTYITFQPTVILSPSIKTLSSLLLIVVSIGYFVLVQNEIKNNGFQIPGFLLDNAIKLAQPKVVEQTSLPKLPALSKDQIQLLKKNPQLLSQYGIDPKTLDLLENPGAGKTAEEPIKKLLKDQIQNQIKPYINWIPAALTMLFLLSLQSILYLLSLLVSPIIWLLFVIFEKTGITQIQTEMREVKKIIV